MNFTFTVKVAPITKLTRVEVLVENEKVGTLRLQPNEWQLLKPMLIAGGELFQDNEATIEIKEATGHIPAYMEGAK